MFRITRQVFLLIVSYTALFVVWGWRLHAGDNASVKPDALIESTRTDVAARLVQAPKQLQMPALFQLGMLPEAEVKALHQWLQREPEQRIRQLTVQKGPVDSPCPLSAALLFVELTRADAPPVEDSRHLVSASGDRLEEPHKMEALKLLAAQALENKEFSLAVAIHERICEFPSAGWRNVLDLVEASRVGRRPAAGLLMVNQWLNASPERLEASQHEDALDLQSVLLLEGTRYAEASRIVLDELRSLKEDADVPPRLMQRALLATHAAGESAELLPWLERHLRTFPDHQISVVSIAGGQPVSEDYRRWLREAASIADLHHQTSIACEMFFRLASAGDRQVLARLHALATQIGRGKDFAELLATLQTRSTNPCTVLDLARALAEGDAPAPARDLLAGHLKAAPTDRESWRLLTELDVSLRGEPSAPVLWQGFLKRFPGDVPALTQLAQVQLASSLYPQALRTLREIPGQQLNEATLRQIISLAITLDDVPTAHRAQQLLVASASHPAVSDVLALASLSRQHPDAAAAHTVLTETVANLPVHSAFLQSLAATPSTGEASSFSTAVKAE